MYVAAWCYERELLEEGTYRVSLCTPVWHIAGAGKYLASTTHVESDGDDVGRTWAESVMLLKDEDWNRQRP